MKKLFALLAIFSFFIASATPALAHRDGCHRWHSCPSDSGSYVCGDLGYTSGCPQQIVYPTNTPLPTRAPIKKVVKKPTAIPTKKPVKKVVAKKPTITLVPTKKITLVADKDCPDFRTQKEAQAFFLSQGEPVSDPHRLDADHDGIACENNR